MHNKKIGECVLLKNRMCGDHGCRNYLDRAHHGKRLESRRRGIESPDSEKSDFYQFPRMNVQKMMRLDRWLGVPACYVLTAIGRLFGRPDRASMAAPTPPAARTPLFPRKQVVHRFRVDPLLYRRSREFRIVVPES